mgnify:CR=1 FL=1
MVELERQHNMTGVEILSLLKVIYCRIDKYKLYSLLEVDKWPCKEDFEYVWNEYKRAGLYHLLCMLDDQHINKLFEYAKGAKNGK